MTNYYQILNLQPTATTTEIKAAYNRERARFLSNDEIDSEEQVAVQLKAMEEAYATLVDPNQRTTYDRSLGPDISTRSLVVADQPTSIVLPETPSAPIVQQPCPHCGELNPTQATMCGKCGGQLSRPCSQCGQAVLLGQTVCVRCNTIVPEYDQRRFAEAVVTEKRTGEERGASEIRVETLETTHTVNRKSGIIFWLVVFGLCIGLTMIAILTYGLFEQFF